MAGDRDKTRIQLFEDVKVLRQQVADYAELNIKYQTDITDLKNSQKQYRLIADNSHDWEFWLDVDERLIYTSPSCKRITGYSQEEFKKNRDLLYKIIDPSDRSLFTEHRSLVKKTKSHGDEEFRIIRKDGKMRWISHVCQPVYDDDGQYAGTRASNRDVTDSKKTEEQLQEYARHDHLLAENIGDMTWTMDVNLNLTYVSPSVEQLRGFTVEEAMAQTPEEILTPDSIELANTLWGEELALERSGKTDRNRSRILKLEYICKNGSTVSTESNLTPIRDINGKTIEILGVSRNITDRKGTDEDLLQWKSKTQESEKLVQDQVHQLRLMEKKLQDSEKLVMEKDSLLQQSEEQQQARTNQTQESEKLAQDQVNQLKLMEKKLQDSEKLVMEKDTLLQRSEEQQQARTKRTQESEKLAQDQANQLELMEKKLQDSEKLMMEKDSLLQHNEKRLQEIEKLVQEKEKQLQIFNEQQQEEIKKIQNSETFSQDQQNQCLLMEKRLQESEQQLQESKNLLLESENRLRENQNKLLQNEKVLQESGKSLHDNDEYYRSFFENNHAIMLLIDPDDKSIIDANRVACAYYGWNREELTKKKIFEINTLTAEEVNAQMDAARRQKRHHCIAKHCRADGSIRDVEVFNGQVPLHDKALLCSTVYDITERKRMEDALSHAAKLESLGILAGGIAHDFNNFMTIAQGNIDMAILGIPDDHIAQQRLKSAQKVLEKTRTLTSQLVTLSHGGRQRLKVCHIENILRDAVKSTLKSSPTVPFIKIQRGLWPVEIDEGQIKQCFHSLAENAREAMLSGGELKVRAENIDVKESDGLPLADGPYLRIAFKDNGTGIAEEHIDKIFDPYFTTKAEGSDTDMGLGLTVCHSVLKKHGGYIAVDSKKGDGAVFRIYLPVKPEHAPQENANEAKVFVSSRTRVLIMDDNPDLRELVQLYSEQLDFEATTVADGQEAVNEYKKALDNGNAYSAVILALSVRQGLGGEAALVRLKKISPDIKAIVMSGYDDPIMKKHADYGFRGALRKPFRFDDMKKALEEILS